jgi:hypothetical protein
MGVPGKAGEVVFRVRRAEPVQQEERVEERYLVVRERAAKADPRPL